MNAESVVLIGYLVEPGDFLDRLTILELRLARTSGGEERRLASEALERARAAWSASGLAEEAVEDLLRNLRDVNGRLWLAEDEVRRHERRSDFGESFVVAARTIARLNDHRAALRRIINQRLGRAESADRKYYAE